MNFRPHHFLCSLGFRGKGYSPEFVDHFQKIVNQLSAANADEIEIRVVEHTDSICEPCPNKRGKECTTQEKILTLDRAHQKVLGFKHGQIIKWGDAKKQLAEKMSTSAFHKACEPCNWKSLGYCESALKELKSKMVLLIVGALLFAGQSMAANASIQKFLNTQSSNPEYIDHVHYFQAESLLEKAEKFLSHSTAKNPGEALAAAQRAFQLLVKIYSDQPDSPFYEKINELIASAQMKVADAYAFQKKNANARVFYEKSWSRISPKKYTAYVPLRSISFYTKICLSKKDQVCEAWVRKCIQRFPQESIEYKSIDQLAQKKIDLKLNAPELEYQRSTYRAPDRDQVAFDEAFDLYMRGKNSAARDALSAFIEEYSKSSHIPRARFWLGKVFQKMGDDDEAKNVWINLMADAPLTYYAILASFETKIPVESWVSASLPTVREEDALLDPLELRALQRAKKSIKKGWIEIAAQDLKQIEPERKMSNEFLRYLTAQQSRVGNHTMAFRALTELFSRGDTEMNSSMGLRIVFPFAEWDLIKKEAQAQGLDPVLVLSLIKQESAFSADAVSSAGAVGLMQIMPFTAVHVDSSVEQVSLRDPALNVKTGTRYLAEVLRRFNGNIALSLAGYNAGPNRADRWKKDALPEWTLFEFVENIPYKETRDYVSSIMRNYYWYYFRLNAERLPNLDLFWRNQS